MSISGDGMTAVAGASGYSINYIFTRDHSGTQPSTWSFDAALTYTGDMVYSGDTPSAMFGYAVSIDDSGTVLASGGLFFARTTNPDQKGEPV